MRHVSLHDALPIWGVSRACARWRQSSGPSASLSWSGRLASLTTSSPTRSASPSRRRWAGPPLTYDVEPYQARKLVEEELRLPYLKITTDYSPSDSARIPSRVEALLEMVRAKGG